MKDKTQKQTTLHSFFVDLTKEDPQEESTKSVPVPFTAIESNAAKSSINSTSTTTCVNSVQIESIIDLCSSDSDEVEEVIIVPTDCHSTFTADMGGRNIGKTNHGRGQNQTQDKVMDVTSKTKKEEAHKT